MIVRKQDTKAYKLDVISLVLDQGHTAIKVSRSLKINVSMLKGGSGNFWDHVLQSRYDE
jgi:hypothetical protein